LPFAVSQMVLLFGTLTQSRLLTQCVGPPSVLASDWPPLPAPPEALEPPVEEPVPPVAAPPPEPAVPPEPALESCVEEPPEPSKPSSDAEPHATAITTAPTEDHVAARIRSSVPDVTLRAPGWALRRSPCGSRPLRARHLARLARHVNGVPWQWRRS
jgi:hypothetical protein